MKKLTLGLCLVTSSAALAHDIEYRVCKGDTLKTISSKFHVSGKAILHVNDLQPDHKMRPGHYLLIPRVSQKVVAKGVKAHTAGLKLVHHSDTRTYVVRNGDQDWALAQRCGISLHALHSVNPGVDWEHLRIGLKLNLPHALKTGAHSKSIAAASPANKKKFAVHMKAHWHQVEEGENDWIIAHKAGIRLPLLKSLNADMDLANLRAGQKIRVPGSSVTRMALQVHRIHSSHVAVTGDDVTIRTDPGTDAGSICTVDKGTHASVLDHDRAWYELKFPKGTTGWVRGDFLQPIHEVVARTQHHSHHSTYVAHHQTPSTHRHWQQVATRSHGHGSHGHNSHTATMSYTALDTDMGDAQDLLHTAHQMRGTRYRWGSASRSGTDCSGFALQVYAKHGFHLPRTSSEQATVGERVDRKDLRPGDLLFFHTMRNRRISHVVIYEGHNKFIHASSSGGHVQENSLAENYYSNRFVTARRLIKHKGLKAEKAGKQAHHADPAPSAEPSDQEASAAVTAR